MLALADGPELFFRQLVSEQSAGEKRRPVAVGRRRF